MHTAFIWRVIWRCESIISGQVILLLTLFTVLVWRNVFFFYLFRSKSENLKQVRHVKNFNSSSKTVPLFWLSILEFCYLFYSSFHPCEIKLVFIHDFIISFPTYHTKIIVCLTNATIFVSCIVLVLQFELENQCMDIATRQIVWPNILEYMSSESKLISSILS